MLATAGVHHHLIRNGSRTKVGLILESGEPREVHHFAVLIGYGVGAVNPYLAFESLGDLIGKGHIPPMDHDNWELLHDPGTSDFGIAQLH